MRTRYGQVPADQFRAFNILLPQDLHTRAFAYAKETRTSMSQLIRDGLSDRLEMLEARRRVELEAAAEARRTKLDSKKKKPKELRKLGEENPMAPRKLGEESPRVVAAAINPFQVLYAKHAKRISEAIGASPTEKRLRVVEAIAEVKRTHPLTHPPDSEILLGLESEVVKLQPAAPPAPPAPPAASLAAAPPPDPVVERVIDAEKIRTRGDV